ncbi:hypothetical protein, partial [Xanthomonas graminis]|uniref:hypothetical protein n=1 Tax=Xanthomonas graminis TaxID=3390026 RepID=UPI001C30EED8
MLQSHGTALATRVPEKRRARGLAAAATSACTWSASLAPLQAADLRGDRRRRRHRAGQVHQLRQRT